MARRSSYSSEDYYTKQAKVRKLRARSYFKLEELDRKFSLIKKKQQLLDLGAAPGAWCQYVLAKTKGQGLLWAIDKQKITPFPAPPRHQGMVIVEQKELFSLSVTHFSSLQRRFDGILSDLAPATSGVKFNDAHASYNLAVKALSVAEQNLVAAGFFVVKYLQGEEQIALKQQLQTVFERVHSFRPKATRANSKELFFVCLGKRS